MGSKNLLNRFDNWLPAAPPARSRAPAQSELRREVPAATGCTGHHRRPPFYLRWWLGAHRD